MNKFYDLIANDYDGLVNQDVISNSFPYSAYDDLSDMIAQYVFENKHITRAKILDLGVGTARIYEKLMPNKFKLTGIDNSDKMLELAKLRFPDSNFINYDLANGFPSEIENQKYDYIVLNYFVKHFDIHYVSSLINQLDKYLAPFGKILIGDILFLDKEKQVLYFENNPKSQNYAFNYHNYQEIVRRVDDLWALSFMEFNQYSGLLIVEKYYESSLHLDDSLVKYKTNTEKWKSSQKKTKRE